MSEESKKIVNSAPASLRLFWESGFFREWRNYQSITERLAGDGYHFPRVDLLMALKRAKHLTRRGQRGKYEYIQKYPFIEQ